ncbi:hypothetical protein VA7868_04531 [Vibrio aerogenes CECT 7868]|uniref:Uncharacterized protein n=1 Tax=Vibrio aerogenes CECT 7868 TaxID=1216006 RepID=A0A1M6EW57_9VIBR|nr:hypothetical protein VA7868_04531 [Vibrio aerogenes CECT 7868]
MRSYFRTALFSLLTVWFISLWLWFFQWPNLITLLFGEDPGLMLVPLLGVVNIPALFICAGYSFYRKYWYWFGSFIVIGGGPLAIYLFFAFIDAYI